MLVFNGNRTLASTSTTKAANPKIQHSWPKIVSEWTTTTPPTIHRLIQPDLIRAHCIVIGAVWRPANKRARATRQASLEWESMRGSWLFRIIIIVLGVIIPSNDYVSRPWTEYESWNVCGSATLRRCQRKLSAFPLAFQYVDANYRFIIIGLGALL